MDHPHYRRTTPWLWVAIGLAAVLLVFVVWWVVEAQSPKQTTVVPGTEQPTTPPMMEPVPAPQSQPPSTTAQPNVNIYIEKQPSGPNVIVVPQGAQPPASTKGLSKVNLPAQFQYQSKTWNPTKQAITGNNLGIKDTGDAVRGNEIYVDQDSQSPYDHVYMETATGSGVYLKYEPSSG